MWGHNSQLMVYRLFSGTLAQALVEHAIQCTLNSYNRAYIKWDRKPQTNSITPSFYTCTFVLWTAVTWLAMLTLLKVMSKNYHNRLSALCQHKEMRQKHFVKYDHAHSIDVIISTRREKQTLYMPRGFVKSRTRNSNIHQWEYAISPYNVVQLIISWT